MKKSRKVQGVPLAKASGRTPTASLRSVRPKKAGTTPSGSSRASAQADIRRRAEEVWDIAGWQYTPSVAEMHLRNDIEKVRKRVNAVVEALTVMMNSLENAGVVRSDPAALGIGAKPTKEAVPAPRGTVAKRSGAKPGRSRATATPKRK